jgi:Reverse transcriptase (RNA-dependent DNA polymerase)
MSTEQHDAKMDNDFFREVNEEMESETAGAAKIRASSDLAWPISKEEVEHAIKRLQSGKATGPDSVPPELILNGGPTMIAALHTLFTAIWDATTVPDEWLMAHIIPVYKRSGARDDTLNYRPIALTSIVAKLYESVICSRLTAYIEQNKLIGDEQGGFRAKRGCMDHIFTLQEIIAKRREQKKRTYLCFLDLSKAYDLTWRNGIWHRLLSIGVHGKIWHAMRDMYRDV